MEKKGKMVGLTSRNLAKQKDHFETQVHTVLEITELTLWICAHFEGCDLPN